MNERNHCIEDPINCISSLGEAFDLFNWINLISLVAYLGQKTLEVM